MPLCGICQPPVSYLPIGTIALERIENSAESILMWWLPDQSQKTQLSPFVCQLQIFAALLLLQIGPEALVNANIVLHDLGFLVRKPKLIIQKLSQVPLSLPNKSQPVAVQG